MKHVSLSRDGQRLTLVVEAQRPIRAACEAIRGARYEGTTDGLAVYSYPTLPDVWADIRTAFTPSIDERARPAVERLERSAAAVALANDRKGQTGELFFDARLRTTPMAHQIEAMNFCWTLFGAGIPGAALLMEQGTGKSLAAIGLANGLAAGSPGVPWALVLCPNSLKGTWGSEADGQIALHSDAPHQTTVLRGTRDRRLRDLGDALERIPAAWSGIPSSAPFQWIVTNYEQLAEDPRKSTHQQELAELIRIAPPGLLIADESTMVKNPGAKRTRAVTILSRLFARRLILTGTPIANRPLDAWAQFEVLEPAALGHPTYIGFERTYAVRQQRTVGRGTRQRTFMEVTGYRNTDELRERVGRLSYRVRAADCLDLPPVTVQRIPVELSAEQDRVLRKMAREAVGVLDSGTKLDGRNILTRYLRMAQALGGFVPAVEPDGTPAGMQRLDPNPKLDAAREWLRLTLDDPEHKVVVFAQFRPELNALERVFADEGWRVGVIHGGRSEAERDRDRSAFQNDPEVRGMLCQYQAGSKGLNLTAAQFTLFYGLTFNLEDYLQARKRIHRAGQTASHVTEAYLVAQARQGRRGKRPQTMDQIMLAALEEKRELADLITGDAARRIFEEVL